MPVWCFVLVRSADFHPESVISMAPAASALACCAACAAKSDCVVGVLYSGTCYMKGAKDIAGGAYNRTDRIACRPKKKMDDNDDGNDNSEGATGLATLLAAVDVAVDGSVAPSAGASPFPGGDDIHGPYQHGGIFPARNGGGNLFQPPVVVDVQVGAGQMTNDDRR